MNSARILYFMAILIILISISACTRKPSTQQLEKWQAELQQLQTEQDSLRQYVQMLVKKDPRIQDLPKGEVVIAIPTVFLKSVIEHLFSDVVSNVTLSLSGIKAHVAKKIKKVITIGEFVLDIEITQVTGKLKPGQPAIKFGGNQVTMSLPVDLAEGEGEALIHFVWNGKNVADMTCGDMDITQKVSGSVIPSSYDVSGTLAFAIQGNKVVATPTFPETKLNIRVNPSQESWDAINAILEEKSGVCGWVLEKVDVPNLLKNLVENKGFNVKLPLSKIKPFAFPAGVSDSVKVGGKILSFATQTNTIRIDPDAIWYSASVALDTVASGENMAESRVKSDSVRVK
jgi:hypothetical protein